MTTQEKIQRLVEHGMSQRRIAELAGVTQPTISRVLSGTQEPKEALVRAVDELAQAVPLPCAADGAE